MEYAAHACLKIEFTEGDKWVGSDFVRDDQVVLPPWAY